MKKADALAPAFIPDDFIRKANGEDGLILNFEVGVDCVVVFVVRCCRGAGG